MHLILLRHGIAIDRADPGCPSDDERWLTSKGVRRTTQACRGLAAMDVAPDVILTSPLVRARQTAQIAADVLGCADLRETEALRGGVHTGLLFQELAALEADMVLCVGHAPHLDLMLAQSIRAGQGRVEKMKKAGAAGIEFETVAAGAGLLNWQLQSRALRALGGEGDDA